ncbi:MAG: aminotransferase class I/II-fold pyridoxal phosphate-dependent enzyme [Pseudomonadota bacterium]|nr:aminotransferase class I/II-fold pyridoxal phosphate-dependent enzyme [Pseudomonadota bacterium]
METSEATRIPQWFAEHMRPACEFIEGLDPFPFAQPSDISGFVALHQNDYLRLGNHPQVSAARAAANERVRDESFMSSIFGGCTDECEAFRRRIADCMQADDAILTTSGWAANVGLLEAITPLFKPVYIDNHAHASLFDGIKLSIGKKVVVNHNDPGHLAERIAKNGPGVVVIDAVYSTDGSIGDIRRYLEVCEQNDCILLLDEAHSFGLFGKGGGLAVELGLAERVHFRTVSLNKALGGHGGLIAGNGEMMRLVRARCRSVIFSSATSSVSAAGHLAALDIVTTQPERAQRCLDNAAELRRRFAEAGIDTGDSQCQIVSILFNDEQRTCEFYGRMLQRGILTSVFLKPATPAGVGLVRYSVHSELTTQELDKTVECTVAALLEMGVPLPESMPVKRSSTARGIQS